MLCLLLPYKVVFIGAYNLALFFFFKQDICSNFNQSSTSDNLNNLVKHGTFEWT